MSIRNILPLLFVGMLAACNGPQPGSQITKSGLDRRNFQTIVDGDSTDLFTLGNSRGMEVCITNYGGRIVSLMVPDTAGEFRDVVLGFDHIDEYTAQPSSFGATVGRYANRIDKGRFLFDGDTIQLAANSGVHTIHGGYEGWQYKVFDAQQPNDSTLVLSYVSPDGEGGFPGEVRVDVSYAINPSNELVISYEVQTTEKTVINVTNHSFFNLSGDPGNNILDDVLYVNASQYTPLDTTLITTGEVLPVTGTPFDFTKAIPIGDGMARDSTHAQLQIAKGIDHNFVLNSGGNINELAARLYSPRSGITLEVYTNEPGIQVYTGNMLDGSRVGKSRIPYHKQAAVCLETQHFPDSPNKPEWPSTVLEPGATYKSICTYRFLAENGN
ncbi:aldose epimerase family protein [Parapedobacter koreensis]|uniref:Aldose 1-epimerase n=1 Tax=Parapedobacter koreensis TaxID=332977 RepID=A0A1H7P9Z0_9SPHI|nr:aldose epimerase family protein [Parapedobacter koreensis]SEL31887.1 aldose 1-epimerase [Parapedobacter koreensis]